MLISVANVVGCCTGFRPPPGKSQRAASPRPLPRVTRRVFCCGLVRSVKMVGGKKSSRSKDTVTREYTINLHKRLHDTNFKKRAPLAVKQIRKFAQKAMGTKDVRLDVKLNKVVWSRGIRNVPTRLRIQISRRRNDDEDAKEELYSYVTVSDDQTFKGKTNVTIESA